MALVTLRSYSNPIDAELAKSHLEASGIAAVLVDEHQVAVLSGAFGEVSTYNIASSHQDDGAGPRTDPFAQERRRHVLW